MNLRSPRIIEQTESNNVFLQDLPFQNQDEERLYVKAIGCTCLGFNLPTVGASFPAMRTAMDSTSSWQKSAVRSFKVQEHPIWSYHQSKQIFLDIFTMNCEVEIQ